MTGDYTALLALSGGLRNACYLLLDEIDLHPSAGQSAFTGDWRQTLAHVLPHTAAFTLNTFPIVRRRDEAACGHYRTKAMVLAYYNALAAGDTDVEAAV